jgi:hypothetical protein
LSESNIPTELDIYVSTTQPLPTSGCLVDIDHGSVTLIGGTVPAGMRIGITYSSVPVIQYETQPEGRVCYPWLDLNTLSNPTENGFISLAHSLPAVANLELSCNLPAMPGFFHTYGPLSCGNDFTKLNCLAQDAAGNTLEGVQITFTPSAQIGYFNNLDEITSSRSFTNTQGQALNIYHAPNNILELAEVVDLYNTTGSYLNPYLSSFAPNDTLPFDSTLLGNDLTVNQSLLFAVMDDEPYYPYNSVTRQGGSFSLIYIYNTLTGNYVLPKTLSSAGLNILIYTSSLPTPAELPGLRKLAILLPRLVAVQCSAINPLTKQTISSNTINLFFQAPAWQALTFPETVTEPGSQDRDIGRYLIVNYKDLLFPASF